MKGLIKKLAQRFGHDIVHLPADPIARQWLDLMRTNQIDLVFDVGANTGQYGKKIRSLGYTGRIVSFEPLSDAFTQLQHTTGAYLSWQPVKMGIGDYDGGAEINISRNSYSSSLLAILPLHVESEANAVYIGQEAIQIRKIDSVIDKYSHPDQPIYVKIDTQGFERQVIEGCSQSLDRIRGFQVELSLQPLYEQETLLPDMVDLMRQIGYTLRLIEGGHRHSQTDELLQIDGYFFK